MKELNSDYVTRILQSIENVGRKTKEIDTLRSLHIIESSMRDLRNKLKVSEKQIKESAYGK